MTSRASNGRHMVNTALAYSTDWSSPGTALVAYRCSSTASPSNRAASRSPGLLAGDAQGRPVGPPDHEGALRDPAGHTCTSAATNEPELSGSPTVSADGPPLSPTPARLSGSGSEDDTLVERFLAAEPVRLPALPTKPPKPPVVEREPGVGRCRPLALAVQSLFGGKQKGPGGRGSALQVVDHWLVDQ
ncbi:hypothetical protein JS756_33285 [Streptomyces actuosus]|uniref:Uncharacterized protein n=1 Tax=Streptomyces actuosus TaxID=1885 RepID=A0ABS2W0R2_STRAS|nr:hypothetical protein [Streptomyces actuosus]